LTRQEGITLDKLVALYIKDRAGRPVAYHMVFLWRKLSQLFSGRHVNTITVADGYAYQALRRKQGIKDGTIRNELGHLRIVCNWAYKQGIIDRAPYILNCRRHHHPATAI